MNLTIRKNFLEEIEEQIKSKIEELRNCGNLYVMQDKIIFLINMVTFYNNESDKLNYQLVYSVFDEFEKYIDDDKKIDVLFNIYDEKIFEEYALKYYSLIKDKIDKKVIFTNDEFDGEADVIYLHQIDLDFEYGKNTYILHFTSDLFLIENSYVLYKLFKDNLKFYSNGEIVNIKETIFDKMSVKNLLKCIQESTDTENIFMMTKSLIEFHDWYEFRENNMIILQYDDIIFEYFLLSLSKLNNVDTRKLSLILNCVRDNLPQGTSYSSEINNIFSKEYFTYLNYLKSIDNKDLPKETLYLKCFQIFLSEFLKEFNEIINEEDLKTIEILFKRVINGKNIFDILKINNKKSLYHFYKTDELLNNIQINLEQIKNYNAKQYIKLKNELMSNNNRKLDNYYDIISIQQNNNYILSLLVYFGYDFLKNTNIISKKNIYKYAEYFKDKDSIYIEKFKNILLQDIDFVFKDENNFGLVLRVFDNLYNQEIDKITINKVKKCIDSINYILFPNNMCISDNLNKLNLVSKGEPLLEKLNGIKLYDTYRFRLNSSIPDIDGEFFDCCYEMVNMHDKDIISNGIGKYAYPNNTFSSSCLTPNGKAASCLHHGAINPNGRFFKITYKDKIIAYSWVWRSGEVLCFDNIEVTLDTLKIDNYEKIIFDIYKKVSDDLVKITKEYENNGISLVVLGRNNHDIKNRYFDYLEKVNDYRDKLFKPNVNEDIYLKDSENLQLILSGNYEENLDLNDVEPIYLVKRNNIRMFKDFSKEDLGYVINSLYFDYCLDNNIKYKRKELDYVDGYFNDDWFVGIKSDGSKEFFYFGKDKRLFEEAKNYVVIEKKDTPEIIDVDEDRKRYLLDIKNYQFNIKLLTEYFKNLDGKKIILKNDYYFHAPQAINRLSSILSDNKITSSEYGNRQGGNGNNGRNYVSVAKVDTHAYGHYSCYPGFIFNSDILAFSVSDFNIPNEITSFLRDTKYPLRLGIDGEYQVRDYISLDRALCILSPMNKIADIVQMIYLQELYGNNLPIVLKETNQVIDKEYVKKYVKLK